MALNISFWLWCSACVFALVQSILLGLHTWEHRRFARRRLLDQRPVDQSWRVALLSPCKGMDLELQQNLQHLLLQDYSNYEVLFIVESEDDPAYPIIERLRATSHVPVRVVISGPAVKTGQKIHNLLAALEQVSPEVKLLAFVDSDACPSQEWLGRMVSRLYRPEIGAITGYRWYVPARASFGNCLLYSINATIAALLGAGPQHIVWGGSWAIRRSDFEAIGISEAWANTLSDDLVASDALHRSGLTIEYEPVCMTASHMDYSLVGMFGFLRRQHLIGRIYAPRLWYQSLAVLLASTVGVAGAMGGAIAGMVTGDRLVFAISVIFLSVWYALQVYRGLIRVGLARVYVSEKHWTEAVRRANWFDVLCSPISLFLNTAVMLLACWGTRIVWRGITYNLDARGQIRSILRPVQVTPPPSAAVSMLAAPFSGGPPRQFRVDPAQPFLSRSDASISDAIQSERSGYPRTSNTAPEQ